MKCFDKNGNEVAGSLLLASREYPDHAIFRDDKSQLFMVRIENGNAFIKNGSVSRSKAFAVADQCLAGRHVPGSISEAMNAMAVTMLAAISEYEALLRSMEGQIDSEQSS